MTPTIAVVLVVVGVGAGLLTLVVPPRPWGWLCAAVVGAVFTGYVVTNWSWRWVPAILFAAGVLAFKRWRRSPRPKLTSVNSQQLPGDQA